MESGQLPDYVVVVRHGFRIDAVNKEWHLSSARPFDPPLSYGGWMQSRSLGVRLAVILDTLSRNKSQTERRSSAGSAAISDSSESSDTDEARESFPTIPTSQNAPEQAGAPVEREIVFHSSPYLRCVQTAIAISSGLASAGPVVPKPRLRIDQFLGEWQNAAYFEDIKPPPRSSVMVTDAKKELMAPSAQIANVLPPDAMGHSPGCLYSPFLSIPPPPAASASEEVRAQDNHFCAEHGLYAAPIPSYALSTSENIPPGFVNHAKEASLTVDYQWDSGSSPQLWGDGGELGEEWSSMHRRFRKGLAGMIDWYRANGTAMPGQRGTQSQSKQAPVAADADRTSPQQRKETVLVIVSHGAGCNALLGALTNHPVLMDISMSSLSIAQCKPDSKEGMIRRSKLAQGTGGLMLSNSDIDEDDEVWLSDAYQIKLTASTDHLRNGVDPAYLSPAILNQLGLANMFQHGIRNQLADSGDGRPRFASSGEYMRSTHPYTIAARSSASALRDNYRSTSFSTSDGRGEQPFGRLQVSNQVNRSSSLRTNGTSPAPGSSPLHRPRVGTVGSTSSSANPGSGLWSPAIAPLEQTSSSDFVLNFSNAGSSGVNEHTQQDDNVQASPAHSSRSGRSWNVGPAGQVGLWGSDRVSRQFGADSSPGESPVPYRPIFSSAYPEPNRISLDSNERTTQSRASSGQFLHPNSNGESRSPLTLQFEVPKETAPPSRLGRDSPYLSSGLITTEGAPGGAIPESRGAAAASASAS